MHVGLGKFPDPTCIWEVKNPATGNLLYLGGSSHILKKSDLPLPSPYYAAYQLSDVIVTEIASKSISFSATAKMIHWTWKNRKHFKGVTPIENQLKPDTIVMLKEHFKDDYEKNIKSPPFMLNMLISISGKVDYGGVEDLFEELAQKDGKPLQSLDDASVENPAIQAMDLMLKDFQEQVEQYGLDHVIKEGLAKNHEPSIKSYYRKGNRSAMNKDLLDIKRTLGELYQQLLPERNKKWLPKIKGMLKANSTPVEYVLVGAAHIEGKHGLLNLLKKEGYKITQLYGIDRPR